MSDCLHPEWVTLDAWPGMMTCVECGAFRDLLPQHHVYRMCTAPGSSRLIKIDAHIVELVDRAWGKRFETAGSCEGGCYDRWLGTIELRRTARMAVTEGTLLAGLYHDLSDVRIGVNGDLWTVTWEPLWRCPMYDQEEEIVRKSGGQTTQRVIR